MDLSLTGLIRVLVYLVILGAIFYAIYYFLERVVVLPQPIKMFIYLILGIVALFIILNLLGVAI